MGSISKSSTMIKEVSRSANPALIWAGVGTNIRLFPVTPTAHLYVGTANVSITVQGIAQAWDCALPLARGSSADVAAHWHYGTQGASWDNPADLKPHLTTGTLAPPRCGQDGGLP